MLHFGKHKKILPTCALLRQYSSNLVVYLTSKLDQIMVAAFLSSEALGVYSFLKQILNYPISLLIAIYTQITFPYFSRYRFNVGKIHTLLFKSFMILVFVILLYFVFVLLLPPEYVTDYISIWDFRNELAVLVMVFSLARIAIEVMSAMSVAVGFVGRQLVINLVFLGVTFISGLMLPYYGLSSYILCLSLSAISISIFIYVTTFQRLGNGKSSNLHPL
jgi:O-antigen/teichoic acid export membrane protein